MLGVLGVALVDALIVWRYAPRQWRLRRWRELFVFGFILAGSSVLLVYESYNVRLPNPLEGIGWVCRSFKRLF